MRCARAFEARVGPHDADVVPHQAAELVPVLRDDDRLVAVDGVARVPVGRRPASWRASVARGDRRVAAARWPKTRPSSSEFDARRFAPCSPVHAHLAERVEPRDRACAPCEIGRDAAAQVVRGRHDRDRLRRHVDAEARGSARRCSGSARCTKSAGLCVMSRNTCSEPCASSRSRSRARRCRAGRARRAGRSAP